VCADCRTHHDGLRALLGTLSISYRDDPLLVRGLDYYTRTLFEFQVPELGARDAVGGGGRYDDLVADLGGPPTPAIGFSLGAEATLLAVDKTGGDGAGQTLTGIEVFIAVPEPAQRHAAFLLAASVRALGVGCDVDLEGRSLRSQMKAADRSGAAVCLLLGPDEVARDAVRWKPLRSGGAEEELPREEALRRLGARPA
jgi:histidyl-tRNA synthetase